LREKNGIILGGKPTPRQYLAGIITPRCASVKKKMAGGLRPKISAILESGENDTYGPQLPRKDMPVQATFCHASGTMHPFKKILAPDPSNDIIPGKK